MKTHLTAGICLLLIAMESPVSTARDTRPFLGDWINVDRKTSGTMRFRISEEDHKLKIQETTIFR
jgi:hypothetical protein